MALGCPKSCIILMSLSRSWASRPRWRVIESYINQIEERDLRKFLEKQNISINEKEEKYLFYILKNKYKDVLDEDILIIYDIKKNINNEAYNKLLELFNKYKGLYKK